MADNDSSLYNLRYNQVTQGMEAAGGGTPTWTPLVLVADGGITQLTGDVTAGPGTGSQAASIVRSRVFPLTAIAGTGTVTPDATAGGTFIMTVSGDVTLAGPTGGYDGQKVTFRILNDGSHSVALSSGPGNFRFSTDIPSYTNSVSLTDYIGVIWNMSASFWDVVGLVQGF